MAQREYRQRERAALEWTFLEKLQRSIYVSVSLFVCGCVLMENNINVVSFHTKCKNKF